MEQTWVRLVHNAGGTTVVRVTMMLGRTVVRWDEPTFRGHIAETRAVALAEARRALEQLVKLEREEVAA